MFNGLGRGLVGLMIKPIVGYFDFVYMFSEGIKNTATYLDDKPNNSRIRHQRLFYGKEFL